MITPVMITIDDHYWGAVTGQRAEPFWAVPTACFICVCFEFVIGNSEGKA